MALGQLSFDFENGGVVRDKVERAITILKTFEPEEGYYVAFSGGKDSQCIYHLCKMGGVKFDAHYQVTSVDPPELVRFIKQYYPDVKFERRYDDNGKPITMWNLIAAHTLPPTRRVRYCCAWLKETGGTGRRVVTGVRWAESPSRRESHGIVDFKNRPKGAIKLAKKYGVQYKLNKHGSVILLNNDNDTAREMVEHCPVKFKVIVNPILEWEDEDVWEFLNGNGIPHCSLYDEGFERLGCIGCPLSGSKYMMRDFERWPRYKELYIKAFQRMIENHPGEIKVLDPNSRSKYKLDIFDRGVETEQSLEPSVLTRQPPATLAQNPIGGGTSVL